MTVQSSVGKTTAGDLSTYEVRTITKHPVADNKAFVSSLTAGKTHREAGNLDMSWDITLYVPTGITEVPAALQPGQEISVQLTGDVAATALLIDTADLEVDIEGGELIAIALTASAIDADSY